MDTNIIRHKWTEEDISYLKAAYLEGTSLKEIASKLNRSVSAINKVLARQNLRSHTKIERLPSLEPLSRPHLLPHGIPLQSHNRKSKVQSMLMLLSDHRYEVTFERVLYWLKTQKIIITKSANDVYYEVDGCPKNEQQILYQANKLREQLQLPIFWVKGVTYT